MARSREHCRTARLGAWLLIVAALVPACGVVRSRPPARSPVRLSAEPAPSHVALGSLRMITPQVGWAVSVDHGGNPRAVVRTTDGGRVWADAGPPGLTGQGLRAAFYGASDAWVTWSGRTPRTRPVTYRTADGGATWSRMGTIPLAVLGASAPDMVTGQVGWVSADLGVAAGSSGIAIFRTTDGGARWQLVELTYPGRETPEAIPFGCDKGGAVFSSAATGWVGGACAGGPPTFWVSHDGGRAWRRQPLPRPDGGGMLASCQCYLTDPVFTSPRDGALWGSDIPAAHGLSDAAYVTHDGGQDWAPIHLPGGRVPLQTPDFVDSQRGFVTGGRLAKHGQAVWDVRLYATADGGATWTARAASTRLGQATLDFVTPAVGFATLTSYSPLRSDLLETNNGGASWTGVPARLASGGPPSSPAASDSAGSPPPSQPSSPAASGFAGSPASQLRVCETSQLKITMPWSGVAAGTIGGRIGFTNLGARPCRLHGWPVLVAINAAGQSHTAVDKLTTMFGPNLKAAPVVILKPHATAEAAFTGGDHSMSGTCPPQYRRLRVTPPGNSQAATIRAWIPYYGHYLPACTPIWVSEVVALKDLD